MPFAIAFVFVSTILIDFRTQKRRKHDESHIKSSTMFPSLDPQSPQNLDPLPLNTPDTLFDFTTNKTTTTSQIDNSAFFSKNEMESVWMDNLRRYGESQTPLSFHHDNPPPPTTMNRSQATGIDSFRTISSTIANYPMALPASRPSLAPAQEEEQPTLLQRSGMTERIPLSISMTTSIAPNQVATSIESCPQMMSQFYQDTTPQIMATPPQLCSQQQQQQQYHYQYHALLQQQQQQPNSSAFFYSQPPSSRSSSPGANKAASFPTRQHHHHMNDGFMNDNNEQQNVGMNTTIEQPSWLQQSKCYIEKFGEDDGSHHLGVQHQESQQGEATKKTTRFRSHQTENWMERFKELLDFRLERGHCLVPNAFKENLPLAEWVKRQRYQYKLKRLGQHSTMSADRIEALEKLGFVWNSHDQIWEERLRDLQAFKSSNGDCNVPSKFPQNPQLAIWVKRQRRQYKFLREGKTSTMTPYRIKRLSDIGFAWSGRMPNNTSGLS